MSLIGENFPPPTGGMVTAVSPWLLRDDQAALLVDVAPDTIGVIGTRNAFVHTYRLPRTTTWSYGLAEDQVRYPTSMMVQGGLGTTKNILSFVGTQVLGYSSLSSAAVQVGSTSFLTGNYYFYAEPVTNGLTIITAIPHDTTAFATPLSWAWAGSIKTATFDWVTAGYRAATGTGTVSGVTVTGVGTDFTTKFSAGDFVYHGSKYMGIVKSITSATVMTLWDSAYSGTQAVGATISGNALLPITNRYSVGTITTRSTQSVAIGNSTRFQALPAVGAADQVALMIRNSDTRFTSPSSSFAGFAHYDPTTDNPLNVTFRVAGAATATNALVNSDNAYWFAYRLNSAAHATFMNQMHTVYAGRSWYTTTYEPTLTEIPLYYSSLDHFQDVDISSTGTWFNIKATAADPIMRIVGTARALVIFSRNTVSAVFGDSPSNFRYEKIDVEAPIGPGAVSTYRDGVMWVGRNGIYFFNGTSVINLTQDSFGNNFADYHAIGLDSSYRMIDDAGYPTTRWSNATLTIVKDVAIFAINDAAKTRAPVSLVSSDTTYKDSTAAVNTLPVFAPAIVINLNTKAAFLWSNCSIMGKVIVDGQTYVNFIGIEANLGTPLEISDANFASIFMVKDNVLLTGDSTTGAGDTFHSYVCNGATMLPYGLITASPYFIYNVRGLLYGSSLRGYYHTQGHASSGLMKVPYHTERLTALDGVSAWTGAALKIGNLFNTGHLAPIGGVIEARIELSDFTGANVSNVVHQICYQAKNKTNEVLLLKITDTTGYRIRFNAGNLVIEECTFTGGTFTVVTPTVRYLVGTVAGDAFVMFSCRAPSVLYDPAIRLDNANASDRVSWSIGMERASGGGMPCIVTKAFSKPGHSSWVRKLRALFNCNDVTPVHLISNVNDRTSVLSNWSPNSFSASTFNSTSAINTGFNVETWQWALTPYNYTNKWLWYNFTNFFKSRRPGRPK